MPTKVLIFVLLLSYSSLKVMALNLMEEPLMDIPMKVATPLTISNVNWKKEETTTLQLCTAEDIPVGQAKLVWGELSGGAQATVDENEDDGESKCSTFHMSSDFTLPTNPTLYQLSITIGGGTEFAARGSIIFAMTAQTSLLSCGDLKVTKLSWTTDSPIVYEDAVIEEGTDFATDIYLAQDFSNTSLCFSVNDGSVKVCLNGPIQEVSSTGAELSVDYLVYEEAAVPSPAALSLNFVAQDMANLRAIVRLAIDPDNPGQPGKPTVYDCPEGLCLMKGGSLPVNEAYEVCGEARDPDFTSLLTATTTIIDLHLFAFLANAREAVLEIVFANGRASKLYTASLLDAPPPAGLDTPADTISVDCSEVAAGNACFGFFYTDRTGPLYIAITEHKEAANLIIAPTTI